LYESIDRISSAAFGVAGTALLAAGDDVVDAAVPPVAVLAETLVATLLVSDCPVLEGAQATSAMATAVAIRVFKPVLLQ